MMKVNDFIAKAKEVEKLPSLYKLGKFGNSKQGKYYLWDCSGLVKGILWGYPNNGKYKANGVPDLNANTIITKCKNVSSNMNSIPLGSFVWLSGHCGIYIGNNQVIESSPIWENGVQITKLSQRKWKKHGLLPWVDYSSQPIEKYDITAIAKRVIRGDFGNGHDNRKKAIAKEYPNVNYEDIRKEVNRLLG